MVMLMLMVNITIINMQEKGLVEDEKCRISDPAAYSGN